MCKAWRLGTLILLPGLFLLPGPARPQSGVAPDPPQASQPQALRDGGHDFDSLIGNWKFQLKRLEHPLSGSNTWIDFEGTGACYRLWDGRADMDTVELDSSSGHIEGLTLRLYNPQSGQWRLYWSNSRTGTLDPPQIGEFRDGIGKFDTQDRINGKFILVRFNWTRMTSGTPHFEQGFSDDGGKTWEVNWITNQTRTGDTPPWDASATAQPASATAESAPAASPAGDGGQHDFDFDIGAWKIHIKRLLHPLAGSTEWTEMDGTKVTRSIFAGKANLATVKADGPTDHLQLLALRLYDVQAHQWTIRFANINDPILSVPAIGEFRNGRGEFYDQEPFRGRSILVRFRIWPVSPDEISSDQAFSDDGGKTWETNWVNTMTRVKTGETH